VPCVYVHVCVRVLPGMRSKGCPIHETGDHVLGAGALVYAWVFVYMCMHVCDVCVMCVMCVCVHVCVCTGAHVRTL